MSLLKKNGNSKVSQKQNSPLEPPASPSSRLFRKSTSFEPDAERPKSQQSTKSVNGAGGGKKKILPGFLSKVFGNSKSVSENVESCSNPGPSVTTVTEEPISNGRIEKIENGKSTSHESINSVLSSSSFSYVNPTKLGGKRVKGKRIPVDDPDYGYSSAVGSGSGDREKLEDSKKSSGGIGSTLDKIGVKIGLKKKYNLQSCESLQYIDACDDPLPTNHTPSIITNASSPGASSILDVNDTPPSSSSIQPNDNSVPSRNAAEQTTPISPPYAPIVAKVSDNLPGPSRRSESKDSTSPIQNAPQLHVRRKSSTKDVKKSFGESSTQTQTSALVAAQPLLAKQDGAGANSVNNLNSEQAASDSSPSKNMPAEPTGENEKVKSTPQVAYVEPQPSTSTSTGTSGFSPTATSLANGTKSNTWCNSGKRKRRAPQPPSVAPNKFQDVSLMSSTKKDGVISDASIVTDTSNDVPTSSTQAALLKKYTKIDKSPPPQHTASGGRPSCGTFEIRPRKKESPTEPAMPIVTRPVSSFASPSSSNTLFSRNHQRYHKRSVSEGQSTSSGCSTNTKGRVHKHGKKKAPPPPNPFGDPDAPEEDESGEMNVQGPISSTAGTGSGTEFAVATPPPLLRNEPPLVQSQSVFSNPFEEESERDGDAVVIPRDPLPPVSSSSTSELECTSVCNDASSSLVQNHSETAAPSSQSMEATPGEDLMEEVRQNMLNDLQEREQVGLTIQSSADNATIEPEITIIASSEANANIENARLIVEDLPELSTAAQSDHSSTAIITRTVISETDIERAQHSLDVLAASVDTTSNSRSAVQLSPTEQKTKLLELKREAEKSPLNKSRGSSKSGSSRPTSIGSSIIYESPLAILLGKATGSNHNKNSEPCGESTSPKISPKAPWYKQLTPIKLKQHPSPLKPFTALVKFSELDKEAGRIVEENRRKSEERRIQETEKELMELFSAAELHEEPSTVTTVQSPSSECDQPSSSSVPVLQQTVFVSSSNAVTTSISSTELSHSSSSAVTTSTSSTGLSHSSSSAVTASSSSAGITSTSVTSSLKSPVQILTAAQVHSPAISEEEENERTENAADIEVARSVNEELQDRTRSTDSSSPTFQSVHAASKHRKIIKPLLTSSPKNNPRSENLAIVQPQAQASSAESTEAKSISSSSSVCVIATSISESVSSPSTVITTTSSSTTAPSLPNLSNAKVEKAPEIKNTGITPPAEWDCPRCTLKNPSWRILCEICFQRKDPPAISSSSNSFMSSILQKVNAESSNIKTATAAISANRTTSTTSVLPTTTTTTSASAPVSNSTNTATCIPSVVEDYQTKTTSVHSSSISNSHFIKKGTESSSQPIAAVTTTDDIPHCENFLSQLPSKDDLVAKKEGMLLQGIKSHEDPEVEELDIGKLRKARLAYFQKHQHDNLTHVSILESLDDDDSRENIVNGMEEKNDLGRCCSSETNEQHQQESTSSATMSSNDVASHKSTFADNEDDFLDYIIQLDNKESITSTADCPLPDPHNPASSSSVIKSDDVASSSTVCMANSSPQISNRYRPRLEAIREGNSQDYMYCYSSSEIAQIYENWQATQHATAPNSCSHLRQNFVASPSIISPSGRVRNSPSFLDQSTTTTKPSLVHHHYPRFNISLQHNVPFMTNGSTGFLTASPVVPMVQLPALLADHQPYANNRFSQSPDENYMNTSSTTPAAPPTPLLLCSDTAVFPTLNSTFITANNTISSSTEPSRPFIATNFNCENNICYNNINMSTSNGSEGTRRLTYEDYRRMGAVPKGFPITSSREDWSSESSSSDSARGVQFESGRKGKFGSPAADCSPGITRRGTLDFAPAPSLPGFPDQTLAMNKLMKRLEDAIAQGDHRLAATLAHDMALMKVNCVVSKINQPFSIRVYVEDRFMQQGPFLVQVSSMMSVQDLKAKIERDWGIPSDFQRWILGRNMAEDDNHSLTSFDITQDSMAFLFIVTPDMCNGKVINNQSHPVSEFSSSAPGLPNRNIADIDNAMINIMPMNSIQNATHAYSNDNSNNTTHAAVPKMQNNLYSNTSKNDAAAGSADSLSSNTLRATASSKKNSCTAQSSSSAQHLSNISTSNSKQQKPAGMKEKRSFSPPPLPPKSPIPSATSGKTASTTTTPTSSEPNKKAGNSSTSATSNSRNIKPQAPQQKQTVGALRKESSSNSQLAAETLSAASALTLSLQQKLSEFKAVAEQTLGKSNIISLPPKKQPRKEQSPASPLPVPSSPSPSKGSTSNATKRQQNESSPIRKTEVQEEGKSPTRRPVKTQSSQGFSNSKEKLSNKNMGSKEKLSGQDTNVEVNQPENRFNGILLQTPKPDETVKPPERLDRVRKSEEKCKKDETVNVSTENKVKVESAEVSTEKDKNYKISANTSSTPTPPSADTMSENNLMTSENNVKPNETTSAPQPKPRGIKKQTTVEKVSQGTESPTIIIPSGTGVTSQSVPTPLPRASLAATSSTAETKVTTNNDGSKESTASVTVDEQSGRASEEVTEAGQKSNPEEKVDDFCQTTLPFPVAKYKAPLSSTNATNIGGNSLLRPSAFVTQLNKPTAEVGSTERAGHPSTFVPLTVSSVSLSSSISQKASSAGPQDGEPSGNSNKKDETSSTSNPSSSSYLTMLELMEKQDLICNSEDAECPVCFSAVPKGEGIVLRDCLHVFCRECLVGCVQYADDSTVKCPYRDNNYACNNNLQEREIKALVPADVFEKYLARSVKLAESKIVNTFHCKTPDCTGWCVFEDDVNVFLCPVCKKRNCLTCAAIHEGMDCQKYQRELAIAAETDEDAKQSRLMLEKMIQRGEALDCPACHVVLLKKWGCDWVRCSYCKTEICWVTKGFRWGPGGKGDVSGGCKCGVNGVKCHPKCTYCH